MNCSHNLNGTSATVPKDHGAVMAACGALQSARISGLPETPADLWDALTGFDGDSQTALFAHCASLTVNVVKEPWNRRPGALAHGELLARALNLDMAAAGWRPTADNSSASGPSSDVCTRA